MDLGIPRTPLFPFLFFSFLLRFRFLARFDRRAVHTDTGLLPPFVIIYWLEDPTSYSSPSSYAIRGYLVSRQGYLPLLLDFLRVCGVDHMIMVLIILPTAGVPSWPRRRSCSPCTTSCIIFVFPTPCTTLSLSSVMAWLELRKCGP